MHEPKTPRPVLTRNIIAYGLGDVYGGGSFLLISMFYLFFLTEEVGLSPWISGLVLGIGKAWDAIADPIMGGLSDRTRSRFGRRRVYFLAGIAPIAISFYLLWVPFRASTPLLTAAYYAVAYIIFNTVFTMVMVPYAALGAELSTDFRVRNRLTGSRMMFSQLSAALAGTIPELIRKSAPTSTAGYLRIGLVFGLLYALPWIFVYAFTWDSPAPERTETKRTYAALLLDAVSLLKSRMFRVHIVMYVCAYTAMDGMMILFQYYLKYNIGRPVLAPTMGALMLAKVITTPLYVMLANRKGQAATFRVGLVIFGLGLFASYGLDKTSSLAALVAVCAVLGIGLSAAVMMPWAILPCISDVDEAMTGLARTGTCAGSMTLIRKLIQGLVATPAIAVCLTAIGYIQGTESQTPLVVDRLRLLFFALPVVFVILGFVASLRFLITPASHAVLRAELERRRAGGSPQDTPAETRQLIAEFSGVPFDSLPASTMSPAAGGA